MELIVRLCNKIEMRALDNFLTRFQIIPLDEQITKKAIELLRRYRLNHGLLIQDSLIAATAMTMNLALVTRNVRDDRFMDGLNLVPYPNPISSQTKE